MKEYIKEKLNNLAIDKQSLEKYFKVIEYFEKNDCKSSKYQFHHIVPVFILKNELGTKNRNHTIDILDEEYPPEDNVVKIDSQYHVIAHYYLARALQTKDAENAFRIFDDWTKEFNEYSEKDAVELGLNFKETSQPNTQKEYKTNKQKEEEREEERLIKYKNRYKQIIIEEDE